MPRLNRHGPGCFSYSSLVMACIAFEYFLMMAIETYLNCRISNVGFIVLSMALGTGDSCRISVVSIAAFCKMRIDDGSTRVDKVGTICRERSKLLVGCMASHTNSIINSSSLENSG